MNRTTFQELLETARRAGIEIRHASLGGEGGGIARVRGRALLFVDVMAEPHDQLERTVAALASIPEIRQMPLRPDVRKLIESA